MSGAARARPAVPLLERSSGLHNASAALDYLVRMLSLAARRGLHTTVLALQLDEAAQLSAAAVRRAERRLVPALKARLRTHELLAHWAPGAFVVVLPDADIPSALVLASDLRQVAADAGARPGHRGAGGISLSIGVHTRAAHHDTVADWRTLAAEMIIAAQRALDVSAANGPGRIEIEP
ncbi:nucleotidyl cyclase domain-containing protein [Tepidimonas charontis]|uniref:GGDEF: diguanylate cyclase (GGDEF) domain protein n=1 Tax=Tepidimonas charontis TaxID=2267262 RepID=A0A554XHH4_9BURK|nr:hypothetical protein [Tepidimonas charontis]TSE35239.1 GGDEF: diguanylate cyclase (GGDEF) domain protein [Tepidimonas charontis]